MTISREILEYGYDGGRINEIKNKIIQKSLGRSKLKQGRNKLKASQYSLRRINETYNNIQKNTDIMTMKRNVLHAPKQNGFLYNN